MAANTLDSGHGLLADALRVLADRRVNDEVGIGIDLLVRTIRAVNPDNLRGEGNDPWLYFYEHFLAAYDARLRSNYGVYYTPPAVIGAQVRLVSELPEERLDKPLGFANESVIVLDPAAGTGAYPLAVIQNALDKATEQFGAGLRSQLATQLANNIHAFEILVGPYAVAHLRITQKLLEEGGSLPQEGASVYLTDTLESPFARDLENNGFVYRLLTHEHDRARDVKQNSPVLVCIGNPPYDRQQLDEEDLERGVERQGGWVRYGDDATGDEGRGILSDFIDPAIAAGRGGDLKNLYNLYVYFWRWAIWRVFESAPGPGVVSFITAASYLRGPGFVGMREHMRRTFDELWIIDLEGGNLGARRTENVFAIQTPVAIAIGVRYGEQEPMTPAKVWYGRIEGTRQEKLAALNGVSSLADVDWREVQSGWQAPFLPEGLGDYSTWPLLTDVFPWQHSGVQLKRTWPIAETQAVLEKRWSQLAAAEVRARPGLFRESRDRKVANGYPDLFASVRLKPIEQLTSDAPSPPIRRYAFRSFDRQWVIADGRVGDFLRPSLWRSHGDRQVYMTSLLTGVLGNGPAATASAHPPDLHHFRGSFGGKDVIPLWRDAEGTIPNTNVELLDHLSRLYGRIVLVEDLFAYAYAILSSPDYTARFSEELSNPGPRLPITTDPTLFRRTADIGCQLIGWHTFGERMGTSSPRGSCRNTVPIPAQPDRYPTDHRYDAESHRLHVGGGIFEPVPPEVWNFEVSGLKVVSSWLGYRMRDRAGRSSSDLDLIRPSVWSADMSLELVRLIWTLEATISIGPRLSELLDSILDGDVLPAVSLPDVDPSRRSEPSYSGSQDPLF